MTTVLTPDARRRITLPALPGLDQPLELQPQADGSYRLVPVITVPAAQAWAWTPTALAKTKAGLDELHAGKGIPVTSAKGQAFLKKLEK
jgi:hypothetical protein